MEIRLRSTRPLLLMLTIATALVLVALKPGSVRAMHAAECDAADGVFYACGEIVVELKKNSDEDIDEVIDAQGGDAESDILPVPPDAGVYLIAVEEGREFGDAVVQTNPVAYPNTYWQMRELRWADNAALEARYGWD